MLHCFEMQELKIEALVYSAFCYTQSFGNVQSREHRLIFSPLLTTEGLERLLAQEEMPLDRYKKSQYSVLFVQTTNI